ncbi:sirohydrochlorin chelatase [Couchioplanes caeruleus]|uniref:Cobalamin biosynthesis protein CbiX n=2 Tax=Couchioplanes caeruleus TaxID=56438 RepID=A0A1K0FDJ4_9ACTN|nr:CbiX/SirB N-terminal domain-containing protein [Couchioplanes caeruleus]OJF10816.1 cobalamin biosynthesis protein CbiX [Couchioplanes caeruleus subsp. caeruleus]ROP32208.1 sirohydrochlorin ferrochelatase [Couchioplanes caeruleus]
MSFRQAVVLVAHGSRDPRAGRATEALAAAVRARQPGWDVRASYLDHSVPRPRQVLASFAEAGHRRAIMVPLLLTAAYHGRVDVPGEITAARAEGVRLEVELAEVLGPVGGQVPELLLDGLAVRLDEAASPVGGAASSVGEAASPAGPVDGVVLTAAGTRSASARATVEEAAAALGERLGVPWRVAYASAAPPLSGDAVRSLRTQGCRRVGLVSYFLAPGLLWDATVASAREAEVAVVAEPLTDTPALAALVASRVTDAGGRAEFVPAA